MQKIKSASTSLSCRRKMTTQEIIDKILAKNPEITAAQILERLSSEKSRMGGLLGDETLLRLIAAKYGVEVQQNTIHNNGNLSISLLFAGLYDVTVAGRLVAVFPTRTFEGEKPGKFATLMISDNDGIVRVVLWNDKADLVERGEVKVGQAIRLLHGYTRQDLYGKVELHIGDKSQIEIEPQEKAYEYPTIDKFATKISCLNKTSGNVQLSGNVKAVLGLTKFTRSDQSDGTVMRFTLGDDSGEVTVVAWNEKAQELEKTLKANASLQLGNAKVKENQNGGLEVHVDFTSFVNVQSVDMQFAKISSLAENLNANIDGIVSAILEIKEVTTAKGETVKLMVFELKDETGIVKVSAWRQHAEALNVLKVGDKLRLENAFAKRGYGDKIELSTRSSTIASIMPA
jgi:replication factor A1